MTIAELNTASREGFIAQLGSVFEHSDWIAAQAWRLRPFADEHALHTAMLGVLARSTQEQQVALIQAHPDLAGRVAREGRLTASSTSEQASVGLDRLSDEEVARFDSLNRAYRERFGFPFVICARENTKESILDALQTRVMNDRDTEVATALQEIGKIAKLRLKDILTQ